MATFNTTTTANDCESASGFYSATANYTRYGNTGGTQRSSGFYFTNVTIPQGATITNAYVTTTAYQDASGTTCTIKIGAMPDDNYNGFSNTAGDRPHDAVLTTATVSWSPDAQTDGNTYNTPDIKTVIQEIVDREGWSSGNAIGIVFQNNGSSINAARYASTYENSEPASLTVEYSSGGFITKITFI